MRREAGRSCSTAVCVWGGGNLQGITGPDREHLRVKLTAVNTHTHHTGKGRTATVCNKTAPVHSFIHSDQFIDFIIIISDILSFSLHDFYIETTRRHARAHNFFSSFFFF